MVGRERRLRASRRLLALACAAAWLLAACTHTVGTGQPLSLSPTPPATADDLGAAGRANLPAPATRTPCPTCAACPPCATCPPPPTPTATPSLGNRPQPVPFGRPFQLVAGENKVAVLTVAEAYRGEEAWTRLLAANQFNSPPPAGMEYLLLWVEVNYRQGPADEALVLGHWDWRVVSRQQILKPPAAVLPTPGFDLSFFPGGSGGGWMAWLVFAGDPAPLLVHGLAYDGSGGTYFATGP